MVVPKLRSLHVPAQGVATLDSSLQLKLQYLHGPRGPLNYPDSMQRSFLHFTFAHQGWLAGYSLVTMLDY